jgi:hypothetical protein
MRYEGFGTYPEKNVNTNSYFFNGELDIYIPANDLGNYTITPEVEGGKRKKKSRRQKHRKTRRSRLTRR